VTEFRGVGTGGVDGRPTTDSRPTATATRGRRISDRIATRCRYADASGDHFAIHLDDGFARSVGLPGRIVHGLCTMAFAGRAVREAAGVDDPHAICRLAVRFSAPLFPGDTLTTSVWGLGEGIYGFVAAGSDGTPVIKDGRAELR
jgi:acyl dehydratase